MIITQDQVITFLGGGLLVFILEQMIKYFRREKRVLGYAVDSRVLAEKSHQDLKITFKGMDVEKVFSHNIILKNIGNSCLKEFAVFIIGTGGKYYFSNILPSKPSIIWKRIEDPQHLAFTVSLLNPGEEVLIELVILDSLNKIITVDARAELLSVKNISGAYSMVDILDVIIESSTGITLSLAKVLQIVLKK